jgi:hypothetical protein
MKFVISGALVLLAIAASCGLWILEVADLPGWVAKAQGVLISTLGESPKAVVDDDQNSAVQVNT